MNKIFQSSLILSTTVAFAAGLHAEATYVGQSEFGAVYSMGNSDSQTYNLSSKNAWNWEKDKLSGVGSYLYAESDEKPSANNWTAGLRYDHFVTQKLSAYLGNSWEGNRFAGFDYKSNVDVGLSYSFMKEENQSLVGEAGYRFSHENLTGTR